MEEQLDCECIRFFGSLFFAHEKGAKKTKSPYMLTKNTSDLIEPRVYEFGTIRTEVSYFRTSNWISPGSLRVLKAGQGKQIKDCWYKSASIPVETTSLSGRTIYDITGDFHLI